MDPTQGDISEAMPQAPDAWEMPQRQTTPGASSSGPVKMPGMNLENAYKIMSFYQNNPQYLANPHTTHVANADFGQAAKIVSMNLEMERLNNASTAAKAEQAGLKEQVKLAQEALLADPTTKMADGRPLAELFKKDENGNYGVMDISNLPLVSGAHKAVVVDKPLGTVGKDLHDELNFYRSGGSKEQWDAAVKARNTTRTGTVETDLSYIEKLKQDPSTPDWVLESAQQAYDAKYPKRGEKSTLNDAITKAQFNAKLGVATAAVKATDSNLRAMNAAAVGKDPGSDEVQRALDAKSAHVNALSALDKLTKAKPLAVQPSAGPRPAIAPDNSQVGLDSQTPPDSRGAPAANAIPSAPSDPSARAKDTIYNTGKGPMKWTGTGWIPQ